MLSFTIKKKISLDEWISARIADDISFSGIILIFSGYAQVRFSDLPVMRLILTQSEFLCLVHRLTFFEPRHYGGVLGIGISFYSFFCIVFYIVNTGELRVWYGRSIVFLPEILFVIAVRFLHGFFFGP